MNERWRVRILGQMVIEGNGTTISRFRTQKTGSLFAYLALHLERSHPREEIIERFWPDQDMEKARASLRTALSSLRHQLEPPGTASGSVLIADRTHIRINPAAVVVDARQFDEALRFAARLPHTTPERTAHLISAADIYGGDLLPGSYEEWVLAERNRLKQAWLGALRELAACLERSGEISSAISCVHRILIAEPLQEESQHFLMRLLVAAGRPEEALQRFQEWERVLREEMADIPSEEMRALAEHITANPAPLRNAPVSTARTTASSSPAPRFPSSVVPPSRTLPASNLPLQFSRFFGRAEEVRQILEFLTTETDRLLTITGPGGAGKTRLSIEAAREFADAVSGNIRICFVPLAEVRSGPQLIDALGDLLGRPAAAQNTTEPLEWVIEALQRQASLLLLDNFEHLVAEGAATVHTLLSRVPSLRCLVTSRQRLNLSAERELPIHPLPVPLRPETPERMMEFASVQMFVDRARRARPDFQLTGGNAAAVAALCQRLEGMPLAIELTASWAQTLTPTQMASRLETHGRMHLASRRRDLPARHQTIQAAIGWSYDLLPPELQRFFCQLSLFHGGWSLEAAEAVCTQPGVPNDTTLAYLTDLREHSLLVTTEVGDSLRFHLLETIREFAMAQLPPDERIAAEKRYADYFLRFAEDAQNNLQGPGQIEWLNRLDLEQDNVKAVFDRCDAADGLRLAGALTRFWVVRGHWREGLNRLEALLPRIPSSFAGSAIHAVALHGAGILAGNLGDYRMARERHEEALKIATANNDRRLMAHTLHELANLALARNEVAKARALHEESLSLRRELQDTWGIALSLNNLGNMAYDQGDMASARPFYYESLRLRRQIGDYKGLAATLNNLGNLATSEGDYAAARPPFEESFDLWHTLGDRWGMSLALGNLALTARLEKQYAQAHALNAQCLRLREELGDQRLLAGSFEEYGHLLAAQERWEGAAILLAAAQAIRDAIGITIRPAERPDYDQNMASVRNALGDANFAAAWTRGYIMPREQACVVAHDASVPDTVGFDIPVSGLPPALPLALRPPPG